MATPSQTPEPLAKNIYFPDDDVECLEQYCFGGYHPTLIGDAFKDGRYTVVHKLGSGSCSTVWLARDNQQGRYVSLKIMVSAESSCQSESRIIRSLQRGGNAAQQGRRFISPLLDEFFTYGPNGRHLCLVGEPAGFHLAVSKEMSATGKFPVESARSMAAQLAMGLSYIHSRGICHGDLQMQNILLRIPSLDHLKIKELYDVHGEPFPAPIRRTDGDDPRPLAPPHAIHPLRFDMPAHKMVDPEILIIDYGTSFTVSEQPSSISYAPAPHLPPEALFNEPITKAADIWTLGASLYEILGQRPLLETFSWDGDAILSEMDRTLGRLPLRWWNLWLNKREFFRSDGSRLPLEELRRATDPVCRPMHQHMWAMGRGETPEACEWDVEGGEVKALEELLKGMLTFEPAERLTAEQVLASDYVTKWAMPAWERQMQRKGKK